MANTEKQVISGMHRPVCPKCERELHPEENGVGVLDMANGKAYKVYDADLWKCPGCGMQVVGGFGNNAISEHYMPGFQRMVDGYKTLIKNNG